jgi:hypothetical protein
MNGGNPLHGKGFRQPAGAACRVPRKRIFVGGASSLEGKCREPVSTPLPGAWWTPDVDSRGRREISAARFPPRDFRREISAARFPLGNCSASVARRGGIRLGRTGVKHEVIGE